MEYYTIHTYYYKVFIIEILLSPRLHIPVNFEGIYNNYCFYFCICVNNAESKWESIFLVCI